MSFKRNILIVFAFFLFLFACKKDNGSGNSNLITLSIQREALTNNFSKEWMLYKSTHDDKEILLTNCDKQVIYTYKIDSMRIVDLGDDTTCWSTRGRYLHQKWKFNNKGDSLYVFFNDDPRYGLYLFVIAEKIVELTNVLLILQSTAEVTDINGIPTGKKIIIKNYYKPK